MMKPEPKNELIEEIKQAYPEAIIALDDQATPYALVIEKSQIKQICEFLHSHQNAYFDMLSCLTGIDNGPEAGTMEVVYNLYSIPHNMHLMLKVVLEREEPEIDSVIAIWAAADWHEREVFDLLGIRFNGHPDLRRILMPEDWDGYPLKKDYQEQESYHNIKVKY